MSGIHQFVPTRGIGDARVFLSGQAATATAGDFADPYFADVVLLVHGNGTTGGTAFPDSSSYNRTPSLTGSGTTTQTDAGAFLGSSIEFLSGAQNYVEYTASGGFLSSDTEAFTVEFFIDLSSGDPSANAEYLRLVRLDTTNGLEFGIAFNTAFTAKELLGFQASAPNVLTRQHMAFCRQSGGGGGWFINGTNYTPAPSGLVYNFNKVRIGNLATSFPPSCGGLISEIRITRGVVRYPGTASFTPPTRSFPNN